MAKDFEDTRDLETLDDGELRQLIFERLRANDALGDDTDISIHVVDGAVTLDGRVGTEGALEHIEHVITDEVGVRDLTSNIGIDEGLRASQPEAADDAAYADESAGATSGAADRTEDSAEHLLEDRAAEQFGTRDAPEASERGYSYEPPDAPRREGTRSRERH
jgi:hypothetical protein